MKPYSIQEHLAEVTASRDEWRAMAERNRQLRQEAVEIAREANEMLQDAYVVDPGDVQRRRFVAYLIGFLCGFLGGFMWGTHR